MNIALVNIPGELAEKGVSIPLTGKLRFGRGMCI